jgi:hypothetical protein
MSDRRRKQISDQCKAIAHMATVLAQVHSDYASIFETSDGGLEGCEDMVGRRTTFFMEQLGDMLNATDTVTDEDEWINPILEEAQRLWPTKVDTIAKKP